MKFNGYVKLRIGEAVDLKPTTFSLRHSVIFNKAPPALDPYIVVKVDDYKIGQTHTKQKTNSPTYNEEFCLNVMDGKQMEMAVFHDTPIGYDDFVANCVVQFEDVIKTSNTGDTFEGWVSKNVKSAGGGGGKQSHQCLRPLFYCLEGQKFTPVSQWIHLHLQACRTKVLVNLREQIWINTSVWHQNNTRPPCSGHHSIIYSINMYIVNN